MTRTKMLWYNEVIRFRINKKIGGPENGKH